MAEHLALEVREFDAARDAGVSRDILLYSHEARGILLPGNRR
jgi:hypothetical protein